MKMPLRFVLPALLAASAAVVPLSPLLVRAENPDSRLLRAYPKLTAEEIKQLLFRAGIVENPSVLWFEVHNSFRDREIAALVIGVSFKRAGDEKATEYEILVPTRCGPLDSVSGNHRCFDAEDAVKLNPIFTLKEVYLTPDPPPAGK